MAEAVAEALNQRHHLLVEAGTGTGKTLSYLVPAIATGRRVIISTGTKNLQEQLFYKDIPFLQSILPRKFKATYLKGRSNYVSLRRLSGAVSIPVSIRLSCTLSILSVMTPRSSSAGRDGGRRRRPLLQPRA